MDSDEAELIKRLYPWWKRWSVRPIASIRRIGWKRLARWFGATVLSGLVIGAVLAFFAIVDNPRALMGWDYWIKGRSEVVRNFGLLGTAIVAVAFGVWRSIIANHQAEAARSQAKTAEQGHITDRFSAAVEHLGSDQLPVRLGGIYALLRLTEDSTERDVKSVLDILCAFVREPPHTPETAEDGFVGLPMGTQSDVQTIMDLICELKGVEGPVYKRPEKYRLNFRGATLNGVMLDTPVLDDANFVGASLQHASITDGFVRRAKFYHAKLDVANFYQTDFGDARLDHASLREANLGSSFFEGASLFGADLKGARLESACFDGADLGGATFENANLKGATFENAKLEGTLRLKQSQIDECLPSPPPKSLPDGLHWPFEEKDGEWVQKE